MNCGMNWYDCHDSNLININLLFSCVRSIVYMFLTAAPSSNLSQTDTKSHKQTTILNCLTLVWIGIKCGTNCYELLWIDINYDINCYELIWTGTNWYKMWYELIWTGMNWYNVVRTAVNWYELTVHISSYHFIWIISVRTTFCMVWIDIKCGTNCYELVRIDIKCGTNWYELVRTAMNWYELVWSNEQLRI